jgi:hypothetical protein
VNIPAGGIPVFGCRDREIGPSVFRVENVVGVAVYVDFSAKAVVAISPQGRFIHPPGLTSKRCPIP